MPDQDEILRRVFDEDVPRGSPARLQLIRSVAESFREGFPAAARRANGRISQWENDDDPHQLPLSRAGDIIRAAGGECSFLDYLLRVAAETREEARAQRDQAQRPGMAKVRHPEERRRRA